LPAMPDLQGRPLPARLVFLADVDGSADEFLVKLADVASAGLDRLLVHCRGYPGTSHVLEYLIACRAPEAARYVSTIVRGVAQVRQEAELRDAIQAYLDRGQSEWYAADPRKVRAAIQEFVENEPSLAWARRPVAPATQQYILGEQLHMALVGIAG